MTRTNDEEFDRICREEADAGEIVVVAHRRKTIGRDETLKRLYKIAAQLCPRCAQGHHPHQGAGEPEWSHGTDQVGEIFLPPEPCGASPLAQFIYLIEADRLFIRF